LGANFWVVGEAGDADEAIAVIGETQPDLVVCDLHMPKGGGIKVARECGEDTKVVMLTVSEQERDLLDAVAAGAAGYLVKSTPPDELRDGLWRAAQGEPVFSPALAALVLGEFRRLAKGTRATRRCRTASARYSPTSPVATPIRRSAPSCSSPTRPSRTTCATSCPSCTSTGARS
jgi:DNA-binding NarL/FixJ family response regulator